MTETRQTPQPHPLSATRQWSNSAFAMALLFATLPVVARLALGAWDFQEGFGLGLLCLGLAGYLRLRERRRSTDPDPATNLDHAIRMAMAGEFSDSADLLTRTLRQNPRLWQAYQYRGEVYLRQPGAAGAACQDFTEAIRIAPREAHLYVLRSMAHRLLGNGEAAQFDEEMAKSLGYIPPVIAPPNVSSEGTPE